MNRIMNLIAKFAEKDIPRLKYVREKYASEATAEYESLVGERDQALKDLEEERAKNAFLENTLGFHSRARKLMTKRKNFIVVAIDEPYFTMVYDQIKFEETLKGTWTEEDEKFYQDAISRTENERPS